MPILSAEDINVRFINKLNLQLWNELSNVYEIFVSDDYNIYELKYTVDGRYAILTNKQYSPALFTHELLHLNLRKLGLNTVLYFESLSSDAVATMGVGICNCIEHVLFFDDYLEMGFEKNEFTMDYLYTKIDLDELASLYKSYSSLGKSIEKLFFYSLYWTIKSEEYIGHLRDKELHWLYCKSPISYRNCENMFYEIIDLDLFSDKVQESFYKIIKKHLRRNY